MTLHAKYSPTRHRWIACGAGDAAIISTDAIRQLFYTPAGITINHAAPMMPGTICNPRRVLDRRTAAMRVVIAHQYGCHAGAVGMGSTSK